MLLKLVLESSIYVCYAKVFQYSISRLRLVINDSDKTQLVNIQSKIRLVNHENAAAQKNEVFHYKKNEVFH